MLERNEVGVRLEGRKTWALLTFLALASGPTSRRELVDRLWSDADDPFGALRWALSQVRKAIAPEVEIEDSERGLMLRGELSVDALELIEGRWDETTVGDLVSGEVMEGFDFDEAPEFARWLDVQRARVSSAATEALRSCAALVARSDPERALVLAERALKAEPFDDALHELVVDVHVARGDMARARAYAAATTARYREEMDTDAPAGLARALEHAPSPGRPLLTLDSQSRALLELADTRAAATDFVGAADLGQRVARDARASGDGALEARALVRVVNFMTNSARGTPREWLALLHRALTLASAFGDQNVMCDIEVERGRIAGLAGNYGAAEAALQRAVAIGDANGNPSMVAFARRFLGVIATDRCDYGIAEAHLRAPTAGMRRPELTVAWLTRLLAKMERFDEADELAERCIASMRANASMMQLPLAILARADTALARSDLANALALYGEALAFAEGQGDHDWSALALRGLARIDRLDGRPQRALTTLIAALERVANPQRYRWVEILILTDLIEWEGGADQTRVQRALRIARSAPMPDLAARIAPFAASHTRAHTVPS
jgi:DNA-binding SARP family transcriptional activator